MKNDMIVITLTPITPHNSPASRTNSLSPPISNCGRLTEACMGVKTVDRPAFQFSSTLKKRRQHILAAAPASALDMKLDYASAENGMTPPLGEPVRLRQPSNAGPSMLSATPGPRTQPPSDRLEASTPAPSRRPTQSNSS